MLEQLCGSHLALSSLGALICRLSLSALFVTHLYGKFILRDIGTWWGTLDKAGYSYLVLTYTLSAEFLAAVLLALGLFTRLACLYALPMMIGATVYWMQRKGFYFTEAGYELPLVWSVMLIIQACIGSGALSLDSQIAERALGGDN